LPGMRNSFGSRTAWLRPCMKILAVVFSVIRFGPDGIYQWYLSSFGPQNKRLFSPPALRPI
jgi:hypothetical protein